MNKLIPYISITLIAVSFYLGWQVNGWRLDEQIAEIQSQWATEKLATANEIIRLQEAADRQSQTAKIEQEKIENELTHQINRANANLTNYRTARTELEQLLKHQAEYRKSLTGSTCATSNFEAARNGELFGDCAKKYQQMAESAQKLAIKINGWQEYYQKVIKPIIK